MYNETILRHFNAPYHKGTLSEADVTGQSGMPGEGPYLTLALRLSREQPDKVEEAWFETYGCPSAIACGSWLCTWAEAKDAVTLGRITPDDLNLLLGGLPLGKEHCAQLAIGALHDALDQRADKNQHEGV